MAVRVRMFAALRDAAGRSEDAVDPGMLTDLLEELRARYGPTFAARLAVSSVLVNGSAQPTGSTIEVPDGAELALLPPVSGGAGP